MVETNHSVEYDEKLGDIIIDGIKYDALDLKATSEEKDKKLFLTIVSKTGDIYSFESKQRSLFAGYGEIGRNIQMFNEKLPILQETSAYQHLRARIKKGFIPRTETPDGILLKKDEYAVVFKENVRYCQERTKTERYSAGGSIRIAKGVTIGGGKSTPVTHEYFAVLDTGSLTLTNKRFIFVGERKSATIPLSKICALERYRDAIDITKEGVAKQTRFLDIDGNLYADLIANLIREE